ncbi:MAG: MerR family transcriptional regulator [Actinomycetota bacterium]|nr:MerR family transcriptional regulator [Actinomycetota bacterium]
MNTPGLRVGRVAEEAGVNIETLRYYERRGIIDKPERSLGGHRVYSESTVTTLRIIKAMQGLGFTLDEVRELLDASENSRGGKSGLQLRAQAKLVEIDQKITGLHQIRASLVAAQEAGCDDLMQCAESDCCPIPILEISRNMDASFA